MTETKPCVCGKLMIKHFTEHVLLGYPEQYPWVWKCGCDRIDAGGRGCGRSQQEIFMEEWERANGRDACKSRFPESDKTDKAMRELEIAMKEWNPPHKSCVKYGHNYQQARDPFASMLFCTKCGNVKRTTQDQNQ